MSYNDWIHLNWISFNCWVFGSFKNTTNAFSNAKKHTNKLIKLGYELWPASRTGDACWALSIKKLHSGSMSCPGGRLLTHKDLLWSSEEFSLEEAAWSGTKSHCVSKLASLSPADGAERMSLVFTVGWRSSQVSGITSLRTVFNCLKALVSVGSTFLSGSRRAWCFFRWAVLLAGFIEMAPSAIEQRCEQSATWSFVIELL